MIIMNPFKTHVFKTRQHIIHATGSVTDSQVLRELEMQQDARLETIALIADNANNELNFNQE